ncbi:MAG: hypothetical protein IT538_10445, partial [Variibacter sp.]|nr:hypothetical protein [Variibacter sp.]
MRRIAVHRALCLCLGLLIGANSIAAAETQRFRRGIGIAHALGWAQPQTPGGPRYAASPFSDAARRLQPDTLAALRRNGFDFVRLAVDPGPFLQFNGRERDELDALLLREIEAFLAAGLGVIVDFHPADGVAAYAPTAFAHAGSEAFVSYVAMLVRTAALLRSLPADRI